MTENFLRDVVEITQLLARIAVAADTAETLEEYTALFTADSVIDFAANPVTGMTAATLRGHDEIRASVRARRASGMQGPGSETVHIVSNIVVVPSGVAHARATANWCFYRMVAATPVLSSMGSYDDSYRRDGDNWLLHHRRATVA